MIYDTASYHRNTIIADSTTYCVIRYREKRRVYSNLQHFCKVVYLGFEGDVQQGQLSQSHSSRAVKYKTR